MKDYVVIYEQGDSGGWGAYSPDVPGCYALGDTREEVERNMREVLATHPAELRRRGAGVPETPSHVGVVSIPAT